MYTEPERKKKKKEVIKFHNYPDHKVRTTENRPVSPVNNPIQHCSQFKPVQECPVI